MKKHLSLALTALCAATIAHARNDVLTLPLDEVVRMGVEQGKLDGSVKFYLSGAKTPKVSARLGEDVSNKKTNGVGKDDAFGCKWAALSALIAFQESAKRNGANAVVDLHSYYRRNTVKNPVTYQCHAGNIVIGVTFKGTYARTGG
ncbi:MAG: excinuclease ATPase subunit [Acidovorax sp.]|uniref:excinuclease ATPase subunit n=1 Tax=Acidovorax sp. TaxID=1872122 RepID=UPI00391A52DE